MYYNIYIYIHPCIHIYPIYIYLHIYIYIYIGVQAFGALGLSLSDQPDLLRRKRNFGPENATFGSENVIWGPKTHFFVKKLNCSKCLPIKRTDKKVRI